ncbi:MAG: hypothetical protein K9M11_01520 [Candidatus Pacebacteria bacterium]|nr:hypothetical protein [Candidatus Paceibacterota bacterium]
MNRRRKDSAEYRIRKALLVAETWAIEHPKALYAMLILLMLALAITLKLKS